MPVSKKRKKKGKTVQHKEFGTRVTVDPGKESTISLQDLINVVAYQEYVKDGTIVPDDVNVEFGDNIPVNILNEHGEKVQVGEASRIPGDEEHVSVHLTDPEVVKMVQDPQGAYSIDKESNE